MTTAGNRKFIHIRVSVTFCLACSKSGIVKKSVRKAKKRMNSGSNKYASTSIQNYLTTVATSGKATVKIVYSNMFKLMYQVASSPEAVTIAT